MNLNITHKNIEDGKVMAGIAYLGIIGFLIAYLTSQENRYVVYHCQQSLALIILGFTISSANFVSFMPINSWIIGISSFFISIGLFVLFITGLINGFSGYVKPLPVIGEVALKINLLKPAAAETTHTETQTEQKPPDDPYSYGDTFRR